MYKEKSSSPFSFLKVCKEDQIVFCQMYQKYLKGVRLGKYQADGLLHIKISMQIQKNL